MPKPVRKHRRFIDKRRDNVTTFQLVHRSQRDPLAADQDAPQRVLLQQQQQQHHRGGEEDVAQTDRREELRKFGVYFDDNYDYLQHLRTKDPVAEWEEVEDRFTVQKEEKTDNKSMVQLPSSVFASDFEGRVGLLNKAVPRSGPLVGVNADVLEVLETLDDAYEDVEVVKGEDLARVFQRDAGDEGEEEEEGDDEEVELDDILAGIVSKDGDSDSDDYETDDSGEDEDEVPDLHGHFGFDQDETKSKFTEYSMSSSVVKRSEQLTMLDDRFEAFFDAYEEDRTGGLELDDIEGYRPETSAVMSEIVNDFERQRATERQVPTFPSGDANPGRSCEIIEEDEDEEAVDKEVTVKLDLEPHEKWDCESIISTYSNIYHHPKLISEPSKMAHRPIRISGKTGMPKDVLGKGLTVGALRQLDRETAASDDDDDDQETCTLASRVSQLSVRNKHETLEEKRERKQAFKEHRRERRVEKKCNKLAFKEEKEKQEMNLLNNRMNIQGQKL